MRPRSGSSTSQGLPSAPKPHGLPLAAQRPRGHGPSEEQPVSSSPSQPPTNGRAALPAPRVPMASALHPITRSATGISNGNSRRGFLEPLGPSAPSSSPGSLSERDDPRLVAAGWQQGTSSASGRLGTSVPQAGSSGPAAVRSLVAPQSAASSGSAGMPPRPLLGSGGKAAGKRPGSGGPVNLVDALEAEVDSVLKGGVAAILAKHNYRPGSAGASGSPRIAKGDDS